MLVTCELLYILYLTQSAHHNPKVDLKFRTADSQVCDCLRIAHLVADNRPTQFTQKKGYILCPYIDSNWKSEMVLLNDRWF